MTGEELKKKLENTGLSQAEIARRLGVIPQSITQYYKAADVGTGTIEKLCKVLGKDITFFYGGDVSSNLGVNNEEVTNLRNLLSKLNEENNQLREELKLMCDPERPKKESEVYRMWMEYMKIEEQRVSLHNSMFEYYKQQKED